MDRFESVRMTGEVNPYPSSAVAQLAEFGSTSVTIQTPAIREAVAAVEQYLSRGDHEDEGQPPPGQVIAVVGDFGTGKTHLVTHLMRYATRRRGSSVQSLYLNAPPDTFVSLYKTFIDKLQQRREIVLTRVRQYYADIVAETLSRSEATAGLARQLSAGEIDPVQVVREFGLMESVFLQQLQERLRGVTDNATFSQALTLLLRVGFEDAVWEWFSGRPPADILRERGIAGSIVDSETTALEAMGVFALLIGHRRHRFVLVIDELDQLLTAAGRREGEAIEAFKQLLAVFAASGAFLVLAGLPDLLNVLRRDVRERIGTQIRMSRLTAGDARDYILARQNGRLAPFTDETIRYLVEVVNGSPRGIISLCYHLYRRAREQRGQVTHAMVRQVARDVYDAGNAQDAHADIRQVLVAEGREYWTAHLLGDTRETEVDYWLPVGGPDRGCAVLLTESLLYDADVETIRDRALAIRALRECELLLVVVGRLPDKYLRELTTAVGREPLSYTRRSFADQFSVEVKAMVDRLAELPGDDLLDTLRQRLERFGRQQSNTQNLLGRLAGHLDSLRSASDQQLAAIHHELHVLRRTLPATSGQGGATAPTVPPLPDAVSALFDQALASVDVLTPVAAVLHNAFDPDDDDVGTDARMTVRARLPRDDVQQAAGVATLLTTLVETFGDAVSEWYRSVVAEQPPQLRPHDRDQLDALCQLFDAACEHLPVYRLESLQDFVDATGRTGSDDLPSARPPQDPQEVLGGLSSRVRNTILTPFATAG
ncbi:hypothetical protein GCM10027280_56540 [Micromonospora polyrhachis]|uniref:Cdc6-like AAA superfamily ATPase n=1 Tax=Micromonospora polyrhachis TaxID=1282883 RepID=A0A7W7SNE3_9ACTN|nr:hypothetical protein [Micromonospora polyrhachis]MBB4957998.1 Cdc6-like AAA superfamily ATPase [Micromonospora polyrhachis]